MTKTQTAAALPLGLRILNPTNYDIRGEIKSAFNLCIVGFSHDPNLSLLF